MCDAQDIWERRRTREKTGSAYDRCAYALLHMLTCERRGGLGEERYARQQKQVVSGLALPSDIHTTRGIVPRRVKIQ